MPANSPYPGESQEQFAMRQQENDSGGEADIRQAIAQRFPDALPDKLDEVYQSWLAFAEGQGGQPDLEQFFQQYEAAPQESRFGGREEINQQHDPAILARMQQGQEPQQEIMQNPELDQNSYEYQTMKRRLQQQQHGLGQPSQRYR